MLVLGLLAIALTVGLLIQVIEDHIDPRHQFLAKGIVILLAGVYVGIVRFWL